MSSPPIRPIRVIGKVDKLGNVEPSMQFLRWLEEQQRTVEVVVTSNGFTPAGVSGAVAADIGPVSQAAGPQTDIGPVDSGCCATAGLDPV